MILVSIQLRLGSCADFSNRFLQGSSVCHMSPYKTGCYDVAKCFYLLFLQSWGYLRVSPDPDATQIPVRA
jgi:hypothetical protein